MDRAVIRALVGRAHQHVTTLAPGAVQVQIGGRHALLHVDAPDALLRTSFPAQGTEAVLAGRVLVAPHRTRFRGARLYHVGRRVQQRLDHTVPVVDRDQTQRSSNFTYKPE